MMKRKQSRNWLLFDDEIKSSSSKISFYKKPICSDDDLIRLILAHSGGMTAMDIWKSIRFIFPHFCKLSSFTLKNMILLLRRNKDVVVGLMQISPDNIEVRNYYLRDDVTFSYNLTDIIGESQSLSSFTNETEENFMKRLARLSSTQKVTFGGKEGQASHPLADQPLPKPTHVPLVPSLPPPRVLSSLSSQRQTSTRLAPASSSSSQSLTSIRPKSRIAKKSSSKKRLGGNLRWIMQKNYGIKVLPIVSKFNSSQKHKKHISKNVWHKKNKMTSLCKDPSSTRRPHSHTNLESNVEEHHETNTATADQKDDSNTVMGLKSKDRSHKGNLSSAKSKLLRPTTKTNNQRMVPDPLVPSIYEENLEKSNELNYLYPQAGSWFNPYDNGSEWFNSVNNGGESFDPFKKCDELSDPSKRVGELFGSLQSSSPLTIESNKEKKSGDIEADLQIVYIKKETDIPDSTQNEVKDYFDDVSLSSEVQKENTPPDNNLVSSSTTCNATPDDHGSSSSEKLWHCKEHINKIDRFKDDYVWLSFDADRKNLLCSSCDNIKISTCSTELFEIKSAITAHQKSSLHVLFPFSRKPISLKNLYLSLKFSFTKLNFLDGVSKLLFEIYTKEYSEVLLRLFRNYTHHKLISMIQNTSSPFSLVLNFCERLAIFRTVDSSGLPFQNTLWIEELQDTSVMGLLNSLNLSPKHLIYFTIWPPCRQCRICTKKSNALCEQSFIEFPLRYPQVRELLTVLTFERDIAAYFSAVSVLQVLYKNYPHEFRSLKNAYILNNKPLALVEFIHSHLDHISIICNDIFKTHGEVSALGFAALSLKIDDSLLSTIKIVELVCNSFYPFEKNLLERPTCGEISGIAQSILEKLNDANINGKIRLHLSRFLTEVSQQLYDTGYVNALFLSQFRNAAFLSTLALLKNQQKEKLKSLFKIFEKFLTIDLELFVKELSKFGLFLLNQLHFESFTIKYLLEFMNQNLLYKEQFHISYKFFTLLAILPLPFETSSYSPYWAKVISQELLDQFGTLHQYILPIALDENVDNDSQSIVEMVKNYIHSKMP